MTAYAQEWLAPIERGRKDEGLGVLQTHSGFTLYRRAKSRYDHAILIEFAAKLIGILIIPAAGIVLFLPSSGPVPGGLLSQFGMLAAFIFVGVGIFAYAGRGFRDVVQVNADRREIRLGTMNGEAQITILSTISASEMHSLFIQRSPKGDTPARLMVRVGYGWNARQLIEGPEHQLKELMENMARVLRDPAETNARPVTKTTRRFICTRVN